MNAQNPTLYYVHDPMCSWCYGFRRTWLDVQKTLPETISIKRLLGGLAPDSDEPMPAQMRSMLSQTWEMIEQRIPGTSFNFDFWESASPRRSTWPACRAVIAAREQGDDFEIPMIDAIQMAYYQQARNPSDHEVLVQLAAEIGCDSSRFSQVLTSADTQNELIAQINASRSLGIQGFPSLLLKTVDGQYTAIPVHYTEPNLIKKNIETVLSNA